MSALTINGLTKYYGAIKALDQVSFTVPKNSIFGILGPNGSGKTTLLGCITEVLLPTSGSYTLFDDPKTPQNELRKKIGTLLETPNFYHYLTGEQNLRISAEIKGVSYDEIEPVLKKVGLYERRDSKFSTYSLGMKQRLAIGAALLGEPSMLIFDEPTNGLDPEGIAEIRDLIRSLGASGITIIMASHLLDEVEKVCNHVAILKSGKLLSAGSTDEVLSKEDILEISASNLDLLEQTLRDYYPTMDIKRESDFIRVPFSQREVDPAQLNQYCFSKGVVLSKLIVKKKSLESMFFELIANNSPKK